MLIRSIGSLLVCLILSACSGGSDSALQNLNKNQNQQDNGQNDSKDGDNSGDSSVFSASDIFNGFDLQDKETLKPGEVLHCSIDLTDESDEISQLSLEIVKLDLSSDPFEVLEVVESISGSVELVTTDGLSRTMTVNDIGMTYACRASAILTNDQSLEQLSSFEVFVEANDGLELVFSSFEILPNRLLAGQSVSCQLDLDPTNLPAISEIEVVFEEFKNGTLVAEYDPVAIDFSDDGLSLSAKLKTDSSQIGHHLSCKATVEFNTGEQTSANTEKALVQRRSVGCKPLKYYYETRAELKLQQDLLHVESRLCHCAYPVDSAEIWSEHCFYRSY